MNLSNKCFELIENSDGHASAKTIMIFSHHVEPFLATYVGPNITHGQVIARTSTDGIIEMLYQALTSAGGLVSGRAKVTFLQRGQQMIMQLDWQWLTEPLKSGVSIWHEIPARDI